MVHFSALALVALAGIASASPVAEKRAITYDTIRKQFPEATGFYQLAYDKNDNTLFASSSLAADGIAVKSGLLKLNAADLSKIKYVEAPRANNTLKSVKGQFGLGIDSTRHVLWSTLTGEGSVAAYSTDDLRLLQEYPKFSAFESRAVAVDESTGLAYVGSALGHNLNVFKADSSARADRIYLGEGVDMSFGVGGIAIDEKNGNLYTVSSFTGHIIIVHIHDGNGVKFVPIPLLKSLVAEDIAYDAKRNRVYVVSELANLIVVDLNIRQTISVLPLGLPSWSVTYDPVHDIIYAVTPNAVRTIDANTLQFGADIEGGYINNHAVVDDKGSLYIVDKFSTIVKATPRV